MTSDVANQKATAKLNFNLWFFRGIDFEPGYSHFLSIQGYCYAMLSVSLPDWHRGPLKDIALSAMLPLMGLLVGLAIGWVTNGFAMTTSPEIVRLARRRRGGYVEYINLFHLSLLTVISAVIAWFIAASGFLDLIIKLYPISRIAVCSPLFFLSFMSLQACFDLMAAQRDFLIVRMEILTRQLDREERTKAQKVAGKQLKSEDWIL